MKRCCLQLGIEIVRRSQKDYGKEKVREHGVDILFTPATNIHRNANYNDERRIIEKGRYEVRFGSSLKGIRPNRYFVI